MKVGFVGNQKEMSKQQKDTLIRIMKKLKHTYQNIDLHMGSAPGSDAEAFAIVVENGLVSRLFFYPSSNPDENAFDIEDPRDLEKKEIKLLRQNERTIFERNRNIVDTCDMIIAVPRETLEKRESETWMAIRYSKIQKKRLFTLYPDGKATKWPTR